MPEKPSDLLSSLSESRWLQHPRIKRLYEDVASLPIGEDYRVRPFKSIDTYAEQILARPDPPPKDEWDDLEALQQVTLGDWNEEWLIGKEQKTPQALG